MIAVLNRDAILSWMRERGMTAYHGCRVESVAGIVVYMHRGNVAPKKSIRCAVIDPGNGEAVIGPIKLTTAERKRVGRILAYARKREHQGRNPLPALAALARMAGRPA